MKFGKTGMNFKAAFSSTLFITIITVFILTGGSARGQDAPFPTYGSGAVQVLIYTDYFCPPCRGMEPTVEPILRDLIKRGVISLTLVDTPFNKYSPLYARYFLYALKAKNEFEHAIKVHNILFDAAARKSVTTKEGIEELFKSKRIPYTAFDPKPAFNRYNALIKEDHIDTTPSCVIIKGGKKENFSGGVDIVNALNRLH